MQFFVQRVKTYWRFFAFDLMTFYSVYFAVLLITLFVIFRMRKAENQSCSLQLFIISPPKDKKATKRQWLPKCERIRGKEEREKNYKDKPFNSKRSTYQCSSKFVWLDGNGALVSYLGWNFWIHTFQNWYSK